jgi:ABC-2 type transport system ATP-binding protein
MSAEILLQARQLSRRYGHRLALDGLDVCVRRGDVVGLLGPNGAGKSTTLRILSGTLPPHGGDVEVAGIDLLGSPRQAKRLLGYLPETPPVYPEMTVEAYLRYCGELRGLRRGALTQALERTLIRCSLGGVRRRMIGNLSKGFVQRVGIAQAVLHDPQVLILDEPTVGLDPLQMREIRRLIQDLREDRAIILSSHILAEIQALCDRVVILRDGRPVFSGAVAPACDANVRVRLRCAQTPDAARLAALAGVEAVQRAVDGSLELTLADEAAAARVQQVVLSAGWGLREWAPTVGNLEQLFVSLVHGETEARDPA